MTNSLIERLQYPSLADDIYLNQASLGLIGQPAVASMHAFLDDIAQHGNLHMSDDDEAGFFESLRQRGAKILNCDTDQLAILASASELLGQLPFMMRLKSGGHIVAVSTDFPAVTRPWLRYLAKNEGKLRFVDDVADENLTERIIENIDEQTTVVAVSAVQFSTGSQIDIQRLRQATARFDTKLVVDVTQAAGALRMDSRRWKADAVVTSGYKWLGGHGGAALAAVSPKLLDGAPPLPGWMGTPHPFDFDATRLSFAKGARCLTQSTMSYISLVGLTAAIDQLLALGESRIESHSRSLSRQLVEAAMPLGWIPFRALDDPSASPHIVSLVHSRCDVEKTVDLLRHRHVICGARNGRMRVSLAPYNNSADIHALIEVLSSAPTRSSLTIVSS